MTGIDEFVAEMNVERHSAQDLAKMLAFFVASVDVLGAEETGVPLSEVAHATEMGTALSSAFHESTEGAEFMLVLNYADCALLHRIATVMKRVVVAARETGGDVQAAVAETMQGLTEDAIDSVGMEMAALLGHFKIAAMAENAPLN